MLYRMCVRVGCMFNDLVWRTSQQLNTQTFSHLWFENIRSELCEKPIRAYIGNTSVPFTLSCIVDFDRAINLLRDDIDDSCSAEKFNFVPGSCCAFVVAMQGSVEVS